MFRITIFQKRLPPKMIYMTTTHVGYVGRNFFDHNNHKRRNIVKASSQVLEERMFSATSLIKSKCVMLSIDLNHCGVLIKDIRKSCGNVACHIRKGGKERITSHFKSYFVYLIAFMMLHKSNEIGSKSRHDRGLGKWIISSFPLEYQ